MRTCRSLFFRVTVNKSILRAAPRRFIIRGRSHSTFPIVIRMCATRVRYKLPQPSPAVKANRLSILSLVHVFPFHMQSHNTRDDNIADAQTLCGRPIMSARG